MTHKSKQLRAPVSCFNAIVRFSLVSIFVVPSLGCMGSLDSRAPGSITRLDSHNLEIAATVESQALEEIIGAPRHFFVAFEDDAYSWERARFFLENYTGRVGGGLSVVTRIAGESWGLSSHPTIDSYTYDVSKKPSQGGFDYYVNCQPPPSGNQKQADINAGNLARFVREGRLELSLLDKSF